MQVEDVDLEGLTAELQRSLGSAGVEGYVRGRTVVRDAVMALLPCSELEAERLVDTLCGRGFLTFTGDPARAEGGGVWRIGRTVSAE